MGAGIQTLTALNGTETVQMDNGGAVLSEASTQLIASLWGGTVQKDTSYTTVAVTSGQTVTLAGTRSFTALTQTQTTAALTVNLPASPVDGQIAKFSMTNDVTVLTVSGNGGTIKNAPSTASTQSAGTVFGWLYNASGTTWYKYA